MSCWSRQVVPEFALFHRLGTFAVDGTRLPESRTAKVELPSHLPARLIKCTVCGQPPQYLTSLCDAYRFPAREIAAHYTHRWEIELGFREIKQGMRQNTTVLRSKLPELERQEAWGMLIALSPPERQYVRTRESSNSRDLTVQ